MQRLFSIRSLGEDPNIDAPASIHLLLWLALAVGISGFFGLDQVVANQVSDLSRSNTIGYYSFIFRIASRAGILLLIGCVCASFYYSTGRKRNRELFKTIASGVAAYLVSQSVQIWIQLPRPFVGRFTPFLTHKEDASFPSDHAVAAGVAIASVLLIVQRGNYPRWITGLGLLGFVAVVMTRIFSGVHWLSDVGFGCFIGIAIRCVEHFFGRAHQLTHPADGVRGIAFYCRIAMCFAAMQYLVTPELIRDGQVRIAVTIVWMLYTAFSILTFLRQSVFKVGDAEEWKAVQAQTIFDLLATTVFYSVSLSPSSLFMLFFFLPFLSLIPFATQRTFVWLFSISSLCLFCAVAATSGYWFSKNVITLQNQLREFTPRWFALGSLCLMAVWLVNRERESFEIIRDSTQSQYLLNALVRGQEVYSYFIDHERKLQSANAAYGRLFKLPLDDIRGKTVFELFQKSDAALFNADDDRVFKSGEPLSKIEHHKSEAAGEFDVFVIKMPVKNADVVVGIQGTFWRIDDSVFSENLRLAEKKMEVQLADSQSKLIALLTEQETQKRQQEFQQQRYTHLYDNVPAVVYSHTLDGNFIEMNTYGRKFTGYETQEAIHNARVQDIVIPADFDMAKRQIEEKVSRWEIDKSASMYEVRVHNAEKKVRWVEVHSVLLKHEDGFLVHGTAWDITDRKVKEAATAADLELKRRLLQELHHRMLNYLQKSAKPLMLLQMQLPKVHILPQERALLIAMVAKGLDSIRSMVAIHRQLYGQKDTTNIEIVSYLNELVANIVKVYSLPSQKIAWNIRGDSHLTFHYEIASSLGLIVNEAVTNSFKHGFEGRSKGTICVEISPLEDFKYQLIIKDDGVGFPSPMTRRSGLALMTEIAKDISGQVTVEKESGTEIRVDFVLVDKQKLEPIGLEQIDMSQGQQT